MTYISLVDMMKPDRPKIEAGHVLAEKRFAMTAVVESGAPVAYFLARGIEWCRKQALATGEPFKLEAGNDAEWIWVKSIALGPGILDAVGGKTPASASSANGATANTPTESKAKPVADKWAVETFRNINRAWSNR